MKNLFTCCYSRARHLPREAVQVQTSRSAPPWWNPIRKRFEHLLAPIDEVFKADKAKKDWRAIYRRQIERLHQSGELREIINRTEEGSVFMCFEGDHCECHRKILAEFLVEKEYARVTEFAAPLTKVERQEQEAKSQRVFL